MTNTKNITVDAELQDILNKLKDQYSTEAGYKLTLSQTIRSLIKRAGETALPGKAVCICPMTPVDGHYADCPCYPK